MDSPYAERNGDRVECDLQNPWAITRETGGQVRPLAGLFRETSTAAEFLGATNHLKLGRFSERNSLRPHWYEAWEDADRPELDGTALAEAFGATWHVACSPDGGVTVTELPGTSAIGVTVDPYPDEDTWHQAAVTWWIPVAAANQEAEHNPSSDVPVLSPNSLSDYPLDRAASGVSLQVDRDTLVVHADSDGWVWLRVPWDPGWRAAEATPVRKGGPGHLVVWAHPGTNELRWSVQRAVDVAAVAATVVSILAVVVLAIVNCRRGFEVDRRSRGPATEAVGIFADTVDGWIDAGVRRVRRATLRQNDGPGS